MMQEWEVLAPGCCECHRDDPVEGWAAGAGNDRFASGRSDEPLDGAPPQSPQGTLAIDCALGTPAEGYAERVPRPFLLCGLRCGTRLGADPTQRAERRVRAELSAAREQVGGQHLCIFYIAAWPMWQQCPSWTRSSRSTNRASFRRRSRPPLPTCSGHICLRGEVARQLCYFCELG